jgi:tryptophan 7-halogenase
MHEKMLKDAVQAAAFLTNTVRGLGAECGFERSFKVSCGTLFENRFLLGMKKSSLGQNGDVRLNEACRSLEMPENLRSRFRQLIPSANYVHFGFEEGASGVMYKVYLEFYTAVKPQMQKQNDPISEAELHVGLKWDINDPMRQSVTRYIWHPWIEADEIVRRVNVLNDFAAGNAPAFALSVPQLVSVATSKTSSKDILYLEVTEEGNPRRSFDINVYRAGLQVSEAFPVLSEFSQRLGLPYDRFHTLYDRIKTKRLGHVAGGLDRTGGVFFTVYYGVEKVFGLPADSFPSFA